VSTRGRRGSLMPGGSTVNAHWEIVVGFARFERARIVVSGHVPEASHLVIDMLAVLPSVRAGARPEAKLRIAHEAGPFCVLEVGAEGVAIYNPANGITVTISAVRVQFTTHIPLLHINFCEITNTGDLDVVLGTDKVDSFQSAVRDDTRAPATLGAPSDFVLLSVADIANLGRCPQAEIVRVVDPHGLAHRGLGGRGAASIDASLTALGVGRQLVVHVAGVPDLIVIVFMVIAGPDLHLVSIGHLAVGQVETSAVRRFDVVVTVFCVIPLLIRVCRRTVPHLNLSAVGIFAASDIHALGATI